MKDLNAADLDAAVKTIAGSALHGRDGGGREMAKLTKKAKALQARWIHPLYPLAEALASSGCRHRQVRRVDRHVAVQLGVDAKKSDQVVRGAVVLPSRHRQDQRVAVFAQGAKAEEPGGRPTCGRHGRLAAR